MPPLISAPWHGAYSGEFVAEQFRAQGIAYTPAAQDKSAVYLELLPLVNSARVVLLDLPEVLRELRGLERRRGTSGKDRVDHAPGRHDDLANAVAGALLLAPVTQTYVSLQPTGDELASLRAWCREVGWELPSDLDNVVHEDYEGQL